jgi:hypothetical protein
LLGVNIASASPLGGEEAIRTSGDDDLRVLLVRRSMQDFAEGRTVELDGWILARTEARLCASIL